MTHGSLNHYQYLFVGGILGEILASKHVGSYFDETAKLLREDGARDVHVHFPNSLRSAEANARELIGLIQALTKSTPKKLILFCHSKGCLEAVLALIEDPELFEARVHRIFCVQPPFSGSSLMERRPGLKRSRVLSVAFKGGAKLWPGLRSLQKDAYSSFFRETAATRPATARLIEDLVVTVKGAKFERERVAWVLKLSHRILHAYGESTDGLLSLRDQDLPGFKVRELKVPMDHSDLFTSAKISKENLEFKRQVLTQMLSLA